IKTRVWKPPPRNPPRYRACAFASVLANALTPNTNKAPSNRFRIPRSKYFPLMIMPSFSPSSSELNNEYAEEEASDPNQSVRCVRLNVLKYLGKRRQFGSIGSRTTNSLRSNFQQS